MHVAHLSLRDFRNYVSADVQMVPGANLFVGRNGQGKTNLIESIGYLSTVASHRVSADQALIRASCESAVIRAQVEHLERQMLVEVQINRGSVNRAQVNRGAIRPRDLPRYVSSVLFAPEDLALVRGDPATRRRFLDEIMVQRAPRWSGVLADYDRVVRQRSSLLKSARAVRGASSLSTLDVWDEQLIHLGSQIVDARDRLVEQLQSPTDAAYASVAGDDHAPRLRVRSSVRGGGQDDEDIEVSPSASMKEASESDATTVHLFRAQLAARRSQELDRGVTLVGPHRDDLVLELNGLPAKGYASHGESWSFALALKLATAQLLRAESASGDPVVILDDVFAELDAARRDRLAAAVSAYEQVLITAAVFEDVPDQLRAHVVRIEAGAVLDG